MDPKRLQEIARKYLYGIATKEEQDLLHAYYYEVNTDSTETIITEKDITEMAFGQQMLEELKQKIASENAGSILLPRRKSFTHYWKVAAAIIIISIGTYLYLSNTKQEPVITAINIPSDIKAPVSNQATITLADGSIIYLDNAATGSLASQGESKIIRLNNGDLAYENNSFPGGKLLYNTLSNPYGSKIAVMKLADGTRVWLNAGSSLTYPVAFIGTERNVSINGEAYFEVTHDPQKPFKVKKGEVEVKVLGTHFNVNAYDDEKEIKISLLEGKVNVINNNESMILLPMQQAAIAGNDKIRLEKQFDAEEVMSWKNGLFSFKYATIETIMQEIARWYNVQVEYRGVIKEKFNVEIGRNENVSDVFKILETTGGVHFIIDQNKIIVMP